MLRSLHCLLLILCLLTGCNRTATTSDKRALTRECPEAFDPNRDYFPDKANVEFAKNFQVQYHTSYKVVSVRRPAEQVPEEHYVLLQCGAPQPTLAGNLADAQVIRVPIISMFSASLTHIPLLVDLGHVDVLSGIAQTQWVTAETVLQRIQSGDVVSYAPNNVMDTELVISKSPSILMTSGGDSAEHSTLKKSGIGVVANVEWQESTALARAEWIKYMALFLNEEGKAAELFNGVRDRYIRLRERTASIPHTKRPLVMTGVANRGNFEIAGGHSYVATMIEDAGGRYVWADNPSSGYAVITLESQIARAADADFWINGGDWKSLQAMLEEEPRYREFKPFRTREVWLYNRLLNADRGNDYWARGGTRPDLILADLVKIFHPDLGGDHEFVWYKQVPVE